MNAITRIALLSIAAFGLIPGTARAQSDEAATVAAVAAPSARCERLEALSNLQRRIVDTASHGMTPLIRFIHGTRMTYQLDIYQTVAWLEQRRAAQIACGVAVADAVVVPTADE